MDERMQVLAETTDLLTEGIRKDWSLKEFAEIFLASLAMPTIYQVKHSIEQQIEELVHG